MSDCVADDDGGRVGNGFCGGGPNCIDSDCRKGGGCCDIACDGACDDSGGATLGCRTLNGIVPSILTGR